jgi:acetyl-CoA synthetase
MVTKEFLTSRNAWKDQNVYQKIYEYASQHFEEYWEAQLDRLSWVKNPRNIFDGKTWFGDGILNVCYNCVDRHAARTPNKPAVIWQSEELDVFQKISFAELKNEVCRFANVLKLMSVTRHDYVTIYMPMVPEGIYACLACTRLGIPYTVVFAGFSPNAVAVRMRDCNSSIIISCDANRRGGKIIPLKDNVDKARILCDREIRSLIVRRQGVNIQWDDGLDTDYESISKDVSTECSFVEANSNDDLFVLYTSGSVGKPKGILHGGAGFLLFSSITHRYFFDINDDSIFWGSGDIGWMGGHAYSLYAPLCNGTTTVIYEGIPTYPKLSVFPEIVDKHMVTSFNTAPTALRAMMQHSEETLRDTSRNSLKVLGVMGEVLNKDAWIWYFRKFGQEKCPVVNMWGQTELGGVPTAQLCDIAEMKTCGHIGRPFFGCNLVIKEKNGADIAVPEDPGALYIKNSMPGMLKGILGEEDGMQRLYYSQYHGLYCTGDEAYYDYDGLVWVTGRMDDVLNVSGHRVSPIEIEEIIAEEEIVHEVSIVGYPHPIKGEGIYAFVVLQKKFENVSNAKEIILNKVRDTISPIAKPDVVTFVDDLPKTRSGKIMRRILRKIAAGDIEDFEDITTIQNPGCIESIIKMTK